MSAKRARASAARKVSRRGSRRGFMRGFRGGVSGNGFTGGSHGCPFSVRRHRPPPAPQRYTPERREAARTSRRCAPLSRAPKCSAAPNVAAPHFPKHQHSTAHSPSAKTLHTSPRRYTAHQDAALPTKMPRCSERCNATRLRTSQRCAFPKWQKLADVRCSVTKTYARWPHSCQNSWLLFPICHRALLRTANIGEFLPDRSLCELRRTRYATVLTAG